MKGVREFELGVTVLPVTARTSEHYGFVKTQLHAKGRPIPENDIWIASLALEHGLTLVTRDTEPFQQVEPLVTERG